MIVFVFVLGSFYAFVWRGSSAVLNDDRDEQTRAARTSSAVLPDQIKAKSVPMITPAPRRSSNSLSREPGDGGYSSDSDHDSTGNRSRSTSTTRADIAAIAAASGELRPAPSSLALLKGQSGSQVGLTRGVSLHDVVKKHNEQYKHSEVLSREARIKPNFTYVYHHVIIICPYRRTSSHHSY